MAFKCVACTKLACAPAIETPHLWLVLTAHKRIVMPDGGHDGRDMRYACDGCGTKWRRILTETREAGWHEETITRDVPCPCTDALTLA